MGTITIYLQQLVVVASVFQPTTTVSINVLQVPWDQRVRRVELGILDHLEHQDVMESLESKVPKAKVSKDRAANGAKQVQKAHLVKMDYPEDLDQRDKRGRKVMRVFKHEVSLVSINDKTLLSENMKSSECQESTNNYHNNNDYVNNFNHDNYYNTKVDTYNQQKQDYGKAYDQTSHDYIDHYHNDENYYHFDINIDDDDHYHNYNDYDNHNDHYYNNYNDINDDMDRSSDFGSKVPSCWELSLYNDFLFDIFHQQNQKICLSEMPRF